MWKDFPSRACNNETAGLKKEPDPFRLVALDFHFPPGHSATAAERTAGFFEQDLQLGRREMGWKLAGDDDRFSCAVGFFTSQDNPVGFRCAASRLREGLDGRRCFNFQ